MEGLGRLVREPNRRVDIIGAPMENNINLTHMLFYDDVFIFLNGSHHGIDSFKGILNCFCRATCIGVNHLKSTLSVAGCSRVEISYVLE